MPRVGPFCPYADRLRQTGLERHHFLRRFQRPLRLHTDGIPFHVLHRPERSPQQYFVRGNAAPFLEPWGDVSKGHENTVPWWLVNHHTHHLRDIHRVLRRAYGYQSRECFPDQSYPNPLERSQRHVIRYRGGQGLQSGAAKPCGNSNCLWR